MLRFGESLDLGLGLACVTMLRFGESLDLDLGERETTTASDVAVRVLIGVLTHSVVRPEADVIRSSSSPDIDMRTVHASSALVLLTA